MFRQSLAQCSYLFDVFYFPCTFDFVGFFFKAKDTEWMLPEPVSSQQKTSENIPESCEGMTDPLVTRSCIFLIFSWFSLFLLCFNS